MSMKHLHGLKFVAVAIDLESPENKLLGTNNLWHEYDGVDGSKVETYFPPKPISGYEWKIMGTVSDGVLRHIVDGNSNGYRDYEDVRGHYDISISDSVKSFIAANDLKDSTLIIIQKEIK